MSTLVRKRPTVSSDLTADIVCRFFQEEITDDRVQRLKAVGELFNNNFHSRNVANYTIDKQALYDNQAVLRKLFDFSTVFSKVVLQTGIEKYDRRIGVCIKSCREDACILKRMQMDCRFFGRFCSSEPFVVWALSHCKQISSNMKSGMWLLDWLHELGKLANGLAGVPSSRTRKGKLNVSCVRWSFVAFHMFFLIRLISLLGKNVAGDTADFDKDSLASKRHFGTGREDCFQMSICLLWPCVLHSRSQTRFVDCIPCENTQRLIHGASAQIPVILHRHTHFRGPANSGLTGTRTSWASFRIDAVAVAAEAANCKSSWGWHAVNLRLVVRMLWHLHAAIFHV